jgi:hypothetical protein
MKRLARRSSEGAKTGAAGRKNLLKAFEHINHFRASQPQLIEDVKIVKIPYYLYNILMNLVFGPIGHGDDNQENSEYEILAAALSDLGNERRELKAGEQTAAAQARLQEIEELRLKIRSVMDAMG